MVGGGTLVRAVTLPVAGPADAGNPSEAGEAWQELRRRLYAAWDASTALANWAVTQLLRHDSPRLPGQTRIGPMPRTYLYGLLDQYPGRGDWPGAMASAQCVLRWVEKNYRARRRNVLWDFSASAQTFRWPVPFPVHNQNWRVTRSESGVYVASLALPGGRVALRLRNDRTMHYQRHRLGQVVDGSAKKGEAALYARPAGGDGRNGILIRGRGGRQQCRVLLKLVAHFPRRDDGGARAGDLVVHTGNDALLYAEQEGYELWAFHGDDLRTRIVGHLARLTRSRADLKYERRWPADLRRRHREAEELSVDRHRRFVRSYTANVAAMVSGLADRRRSARLVYDDSERGFLPQYEYAALREQIGRKCDEVGVEFVTASGGVVDETPGAARNVEGESCV